MPEAKRPLSSMGGPFPISESPRGRSGEPRRRRNPALILAALLPIGLVLLALIDPAIAPPLFVLVLGQVGTRKTYRLSVQVDPKINAFLILEKARTGMTISEIVEAVLRAHERQRRNKGPPNEPYNDILL